MEEGLTDVLTFKHDEREDYYTILGCDELSSKEQISTEYKARVLTCHPDKHPGDAEKAKAFELIQTAKEVLCDDERRANYDKWKHAGIAMSYRKWCNMRDSVHTSMHWASPKKEYMLEGEGQSTRGQGDIQRTHDKIVMQGKHEPGDLSFLRTGSSSSKNSKQQKVSWQRDPASSDILNKFRNYEI